MTPLATQRRNGQRQRVRVKRVKPVVILGLSAQSLATGMDCCVNSIAAASKDPDVKLTGSKIPQIWLRYPISEVVRVFPKYAERLASELPAGFGMMALVMMPTAVKAIKEGR